MKAEVKDLPSTSSGEDSGREWDPWVRNAVRSTVVTGAHRAGSSAAAVRERS